MTVYDATWLATYVGLPAPNDLVFACWEEAASLVDGYLNGGEWPSGSLTDPPSLLIPFEVIGRAVTEVGAELFHRKNTKNAVAQFATPDGSPFRIARDPLVAAYPILRPYMGGGFA